MEIGRREGASIACGGKRATERGLERGYFFQFTVLVDVGPKMRVAQEKIFGPVTDIITCFNLEDAVAIKNDVPYGLVTSIYTRDVSKAFWAMERITTGILYINTGTIGAANLRYTAATLGLGSLHNPHLVSPSC